jgi:hypothetical protein
MIHASAYDVSEQRNQTLASIPNKSNDQFTQDNMLTMPQLDTTKVSPEYELKSVH